MKDMLDQETIDTFEQIEHRQQMNVLRSLKLAMQAMQFMLNVFADRVLVVLALVFSVGLFAWGMVEPSGLRFFGAISFTVLAFLPMLFMYYKREVKRDA